MGVINPNNGLPALFFLDSGAEVFARDRNTFIGLSFDEHLSLEFGDTGLGQHPNAAAAVLEFVCADAQDARLVDDFAPDCDGFASVLVGIGRDVANGGDTNANSIQKFWLGDGETTAEGDEGDDREE